MARALLMTSSLRRASSSSSLSWAQSRPTASAAWPKSIWVTSVVPWAAAATLVNAGAKRRARRALRRAPFMAVIWVIS